MKKLLLLSSLCIALCTAFLFGCKVKKEAKQTQEIVEQVDESTHEYESGDVVPAPGTINQQELDSIKSIRNKEKRIKK